MEIILKKVLLQLFAMMDIYKYLLIIRVIMLIKG